MPISSSSSSWRMLLLPLLCLLMAAAAAANQQPQHHTWTPPPPVMTTLPGCPDKCGDVVIPYPFGMKDGCFLPGFRVICNHSFHPPRPFLDSNLTLDDDADRYYYSNSNRTQIIVKDYLYYYNSTGGGPWTETEPKYSVRPIELVAVSVSEGKAWVRGAFGYDCELLNDSSMHHSVREPVINFADTSPFLLSDADDVLMGIGGDVVAQQTLGPLCQSYIPWFNDPSWFNTSGPDNGSCSSGLGCCWAYVPPTRMGSHVTIQQKTTMTHGSKVGGSPGGVKNSIDDDSSGFSSCSYAMIVDRSWYNFSLLHLELDNDAFLRRNPEGLVPVVLDFTVGEGGCPKAACASINSECAERPVDVVDDNNKPHRYYYFCRCSPGYQGNPYISDGCRDIDECAQPNLYPCHGKCKNTPGNYECTCPAGTRGNNAKQEPCADLFSLPAKISVGAICGLFIIALLVFVVLIRNEKRKMTDFFKKNGGPTLEKAKIIKIYRKEELNPILTSSNFIGRGAFGEVYKGVLDNQLVAVKKPIDSSAAQTDQFANEVIIQSQVIHKNIVKLIGCCLEVDKPMLVYEFLSRGSLDDILHGSSGVPLTLEQRLNIAAESAEGLAYMHSKTGKIILHGDVKPANILLNDNFSPKISDFGISRMIVKDKEKTDDVIGDRTYIDPLFILDGRQTDKNDVYSFGVVLLELISRKKATYSDNNSLVTNFRNAHNNRKEATELFDKEIAKQEVLELLDSLYKLAVSCLNLEDLDKRPNMTRVAERLLELKRKHDIGSREATDAEENFEWYTD